jgi:hypothetical protein
MMMHSADKAMLCGCLAIVLTTMVSGFAPQLQLTVTPQSQTYFDATNHQRQSSDHSHLCMAETDQVEDDKALNKFSR